MTIQRPFPNRSVLLKRNKIRTQSVFITTSGIKRPPEDDEEFGNNSGMRNAPKKQRQKETCKRRASYSGKQMEEEAIKR